MAVKKNKNKNKKKTRKNVSRNTKKQYRKNTSINTNKKSKKNNTSKNYNKNYKKNSSNNSNKKNRCISIKKIEEEKDIVNKEREISKKDIEIEEVLVEKDNVLEDKNDVLDSNNVKDNTYKNILGSIIVIFVIFVLGLFIMCFPRIVLNGSLEMIIGYNEIYVEPGFKGYIYDEDITEKVDVVSDIKNGVLGEYEVNYYIDLLGARVKKTRKVKIVDDVAPKISVDNDVIRICPNGEIPDIKYESFDEYDGNITSRVEKIISSDEVLFKVSDLSNNFTSVNVKINRVDSEKPVINLKGSSVMYLDYGSTFLEPGFSAVDNCSGDLTDKVKVSGSVSRNIGTYELKYEVTDDSGNKEIVTRKVIIGTKVNDNGSVNKGTIYLTFDDGPNQGTTNKILDVLKKENIKVTFFVTCNGPDSLIKRMYDEGHTVALHTASHNYSYIYSSIDNYFKDLNKVSERVKKITGESSKILRFPGGSSNAISKSYNKGIMTELSNIVLNQGYRYFDWNVDGMDASTARTSRDVYYNVTSRLSYNQANVVLLHDTKSITANAIEDIIRFGKEHGYKFSAIDMNTYMVRHKIIN